MSNEDKVSGGVQEPVPSASEADPEMVMGFLLWLDCLDRLAVLTLEIRHFQCNLIHALGEPILYRPLRFEERYLWGQYGGRDTSWLDVFETPGLKARDVEALASLWIIRYPLHDEVGETADYAEKDVHLTCEICGKSGLTRRGLALHTVRMHKEEEEAAEAA